MTIKQLEKIAWQARYDLVKRVPVGLGLHWGGSMSLMEILSVLYFKFLKIDPKNPKKKNRDRLILSKGHGSPAQYAMMAERGFFPKSWLSRIDENGWKLPKHAHRLKLAGIEASTGALAQGLSMGIGMALAAKLDKAKWHTYVIGSDGECTEGQFWEAALSANKFRLDNLTLIIDNNRMTLDNHIKIVMPSLNISKMFKAAGWQVYECDGHNVKQLVDRISRALKIKNKPVAIVANTIKGKGISFMEDNPSWHSGKLTKEQKEKALKEISKRLKKYE
ncbi:transketolase [bacterium]|nr:transketolase [bacterium]